MPQTGHLPTSAEDGYIHDFGGLSVNKTATTMLSGTSSSSDTVSDEAHAFPDTSDGTSGIPAAGIVDQVDIWFYCSATTSNASGTLNIYISATGAEGTTLDTTDWHKAGETFVTAVANSSLTIGWNKATIVGPYLNRSGTTNIRMQTTAGSSPGDTSTFHTFENASGNKLYLVATYHVPGGGPQMSMIGVGT
jgi:hypothetical protein